MTRVLDRLQLLQKLEIYLGKARNERFVVKFNYPPALGINDDIVTMLSDVYRCISLAICIISEIRIVTVFFDCLFFFLLPYRFPLSVDKVLKIIIDFDLIVPYKRTRVHRGVGPSTHGLGTRLNLSSFIMINRR